MTASRRRDTAGQRAPEGPRSGRDGGDGYDRSPFAEFERKRWQEEARHVVCPSCGYAAGRHSRSCDLTS